MSLKGLTELRKSGQVPNAVWVLIGDGSSRLEDNPSVVLIDSRQDPLSIDFRPLVGLHVDVFEVCGDDLFCERIERAIDAARPKSSGLATRHGFSGLNEKHVEMLRKAWELLCN